MGCKLALIDLPSTKREMRVDLFKRLEAGDTLVLFSWKDLGAGTAQAAFRARLEGMGVNVELVDPPNAKPAPASSHGLPDDAITKAKTMWPHPEYSVATIQAVLLAEGFGVVTRNQLNHALGPRYKK